MSWALSVDWDSCLFGVQVCKGERHPFGPDNVTVNVHFGPLVFDISWGPQFREEAGR